MHTAIFLSTLLGSNLSQHWPPKRLGTKTCIAHGSALSRFKVLTVTSIAPNRGSEPAIAFVKEAKDATIFVRGRGNPEKKRDFLRKIGSNLKVEDKRLSVELKNPWKIVAEFNSAPVQRTAACGENLKISKWRREGDSNPRYLLGTHAFQACALNHSATSPTYLITGTYIRTQHS